MRMRLLAAAAVLVSAAVHLKLWIDVFRDQEVVGPAFLANVFGGVVIALLLVLWRHWLPLLLSVGFGASTIAAFVTAATVGLFGVHEHWTGVYVWTAFGSEVVAILAGVLAAVGEGWLSGEQSQHERAVRRAHLR
jgi:hypothetical protein